MHMLQMQFDHIGIPSEEPRPDETFVEATRVWVTNPREHPQSLEFLRYEPDTTITGGLRVHPHIAFRVPPGTLDAVLEGQEVVLGPWEAQKGVVRVAFVHECGTYIEYMEYMGDPKQWFPHERGQK